MPPLAEFPRAIAIPTEEIRSALESVAVPGYTGTLQLEIGLREEVAQCVTIRVIRRQSKRLEEIAHPAVTHQSLPDPTRKKPVEKVLGDLRSKLLILSMVAAVEVQVLDGVLQKVIFQE